MRLVIVGASGNVGTALLSLLASGSTRFSSRKNLSSPTEPHVIGVTSRTPPDDTPYEIARWESVDISAPGAVDRLARVFDGADAVVNLAFAVHALGTSRARSVLGSLAELVTTGPITRRPLP